MKLLAALAIFLAPAALAQTTVASQAPAQQSPSFSTGTTLVLVPALVRTRSGEMVFSLTAKDFIVTDDGVEQKLSLEEDTGDQPLALVVAVETGGAGATHLDKYRNLPILVEAAVGDVQHRVAIVAFDNRPTLQQDFTSDLNVARQAIYNLQPGNSGAAILDALGFSVDLLRRQPPQYRRAILLLSETLDFGSRSSLEDSLRAISDTNTAIYSMAFSSTRSQMKHERGQFSSSEPGPAGGCMARDTKPDPDADTNPDTAGAPAKTQNRAAQAYDCLSLLAPPLRLAKMAAMAAANSLRRNVPETVASLTGGEYYKFEKARDLERDLVTISNHIPNRYVLSFHPQSPHPGLHTLAVHLNNRSDLGVTARTSYWVDTDASASPRPKQE